MFNLSFLRSKLSFLEAVKRIIFSDVISQILYGMLGALIALIIVHYTPPFEQRKIVTVDITSIVNNFVQSQSKLNLSTKEIQVRVNLFGKNVESTLNEFAKKHHVVVMPQEAVIAGSPDVTPLIQQDLKTREKKDTENTQPSSGA